MPATEVSEHRQTQPQLRRPMKAGAEQEEELACPRCESRKTKFCYYNNYNFSQPRHFCKSCRRYWTHGGTLRDIPVGGATRKNAKRSRLLHPGPPPPTPPPTFTSPFLALPAACFGLGLGLGLGLDDPGFGLARGVWAFPAAGDPLPAAVGGGNAGPAMGVGMIGIGAAAPTPGGWNGDFCSWAEPVFSTPSTGFFK